MNGCEPWQRILPVEEVNPELVGRFTCGDERMDTWFLTKASTWCYLGFCQVYVALDESGIVGFYSLSPTSIAPESLTNSMKMGKRSMEHPGILLGRIATRVDMQKSGRRIGSSLLWHAIRRSIEIASLVGGRFVVLDAKDEGLAAWYERNGFVPLKNNNLRMVLPMKRAREMLETRGKDA